MAKYTKESQIAEVLQKCPGAVNIFSRHGLNCYECMGADVETIEEVPIMHPELDVEALLRDLNASCSE